MPMRRLVSLVAFAILSLSPLARSQPVLGGAPAGPYKPPPGPQVDWRQLDTGNVESLVRDPTKYPAPEWLRPGLRLVYTGSDGVRAGVERPAVWDPVEKKWKTQKGEDWWSSLSDRSGGVGFSHDDVASVTTTTASLSCNTFLIKDIAQGLITPGGASQVVGLPSAAGGLWIHPAALKTVEEINQDGVRIIRGPWHIGQADRAAIMIQTSSRDAWRLRVFDLETGILLVDATQTAIITRDVAGTQTTHTAFVGIRQLDIPWAGAKPPEWTKTFQSADYAGQYTAAMPGGQPMVQQLAMRVEAGERLGDVMKLRWARQDSQGPGMPPITAKWESLAGGDGFLGLWTPPEGLAKLKEGQMLDKDPFTKVTLTVGRPMPMADGRALVVIAREGPGFSEYQGYDPKSGILTYIQRDQSMPQGMGGTRLVLTLTGVR